MSNSTEGEEVYEYLVKWIAFMFKYPHKKTRVAIVIRSDGIGKDTLFYFIGEYLMGIISIIRPIVPRLIFSHVHHLAEMKKLLVLDEANCQASRKICPLITNEKTTIRRVCTSGRYQ